MRVFGKHGADPGEREWEQPFELDLELHLDLGSASHSDDLNATVDYAELHSRVTSIVQSTSFALLERLAAEVMNAIFTDVRVARASVRVAKPQLLAGATPSVTLVRENPRHRAAFP